MTEQGKDLHTVAREVFLRHAGRNHRTIESEIRALGFPRFDRRCFYARVRNGKRFPGWIEKFGWTSDVQSSSFGLQASPPDEFKQWLKQVSPEMNWEWEFQQQIFESLHRITTGENKRLMIFLPPRHGKSELATVRYAGWRLWRDPAMRVVIGSYNQHLSNKFSRSLRTLLSDEEDKVIAAGRPECETSATSVSDGARATADMRIRENTQCPDSMFQVHRNGGRMFPRARGKNSEGEWETALRGGVKAVGVGAGITGYGAMLMIIDDPVKGRAVAESETFRQKTWDWFNDDIYTRLEPGASIILIQTRWHEDDLAGRLLKEMENGGEQWEVLSLPALAEETSTENGKRTMDNSGSDIIHSPLSTIHSSHSPLSTIHSSRSPLSILHSKDPLDRSPGEALCPERYDREDLLRIRKKIGSYAFSALYQQSPVPRDGGLFKQKWFSRIIDRAPEGLRWHRAYDLAVSTKTSADYTASFRCAKDKDGNLYIADGFRARIEYPEQRAYVIGRMKSEKNTAHAIEEALHGKAFVQELRRELRLSGVPLSGVRVDNDKFTRALAWSNTAEAGKVVLIRGPWIDDFLEEVCLFPNAPHDDQVDAVSLAVQMIGIGSEKKLYRSK